MTENTYMQFQSMPAYNYNSKIAMNLTKVYWRDMLI